jgi:hypothetical protein
VSSRASAGHDAPPTLSESARADFTARLLALGQADLAPAPSSPFTTLTANVAGRSRSFTTYRNAAGDQCLMEEHPGGARGYGCLPRRNVFAGGPLFARWGSSQGTAESRDAGRWDAAWVEGIAAPVADAVILVLSDCTELRLPLSQDRSFFAVIGPEHLHAGVLPVRVDAADATGKTIDSRAVSLGPPSAKAGNIGPPPALTTPEC